MASRRNTGETGTRNDVDVIDNIFNKVLLELSIFQETLHLKQQEMLHKFEIILQQQEADFKHQEARQLEEADRKYLDALYQQEEKMASVWCEMERQGREKDNIIRALEQRLEDMERRGPAEQGGMRSVGYVGDGSSQPFEGFVQEVEAPSQNVISTSLPRGEAVPYPLEESQSTHAFLATADCPVSANAQGAAVPGWVAAGGAQQPPPPEAFPAPSFPPTPTSSGADHQDAAADEEELTRRRVKLRARQVQEKVKVLRNSPSPLAGRLLQAALDRRLAEVRRLVASGADVNYPDESGNPPLFKVMAWRTHGPVVALLLELGADVNAVNCCGCSALHWAMLRRRARKYVEQLVEAGADVNARDVDGETPLHWAADRNKRGSALALLAAGAIKDLKPWSGKWKGKTPLEIARTPEIWDILRM